MIFFLSISKTFANFLQVELALFAGLVTNKSGITFFSFNRFAIKGASFLPLSFNGRSKSSSKAFDQLDLACRITTNLFTARKCKNRPMKSEKIYIKFLDHRPLTANHS